MGKRNFADFSESPYTPHDRSQSLQVTRLFQKFEYGVMTLSKALKVARGFERQKLGRREKTAQKEEGEKKEGTLSRIAEEIQVVKTLDPHATAEKYLFKQLLKTKRIAESPLFIQFKDKKKLSAEGPKSTAEANVTARLYKSTPVKNVFPGIMEGIRKLLGIEDKPADGKKKDAKKSSKEEKSSSSKKKAEAETARTSASADPSASPSGDEDINMSDAGSDAESIDYAQFDARLAPDSGDENEDGSEGDEGLDPNEISDVEEEEEEEEEDEEEEESDDDQHISISRSPSPSSPPTKKPKATSKASSTPATSTTFLPSLTMGGYWSGSEDEAEDGAAANEPPRRKNRMGQQARRALWEKKYGSGANHVKQEKNKRKGGGRDSGWDVRRGATDGGERWGRGGGQHQGWGRPQQQNQQFGRPQRGGPPAKKPEDNKPLHPSWEAARKAKEQKATAAFQGKKVTFD
ncbi:Bud-site selection protein [Aspergillus costaricaensis CBS 115574]|uniref:Bud-site selection protein n=1 Tax=Aspergillus costaricaensis CBS 115574 TaxID=1448317 RepID=A0ACD1IJB0_9EURO|nr:Bud-site selection protein [Aspergillus costaricaensis CBS 115574]RAK90196.1 Bud-site selection protein [Aspergillus costaricaensis CBS 115574]